MKTHDKSQNNHEINKGHNCDNCKYYEWYYDYCKKWKCKVDDREVHSCFAKRGEARTNNTKADLVNLGIS